MEQEDKNYKSELAEQIEKFNSEHKEKIKKYRLELAVKRLKTLKATFDMLSAHGYIDGKRFTFNRSLMIATLKHYIQDLDLLKERYRIEDRAQAQKVAGLFTVAIMRFKLLTPADKNDGDLLRSDANEILAIFHGLNICAEKGNGEVDMLIVDSIRQVWLP